MTSGIFGNKLSITSSTIKKPEEKFTREKLEQFLNEFNTAGTLEALTESEGQAIARFKSFDAFRVRLIAEGGALFSRIHQEVVPAYQVRLANIEADASSSAFTPAEP